MAFSAEGIRLGQGGARPGAGHPRKGEPLRTLTVEPQPKHRHVALVIRAYIQREGMSLSEFGRQVGGSPSAPHAWAEGTGGVSRRFQPKVARLLGVPVSFLAPWDGEGDPPDLVGATDGPGTALGPVRAARALVTREAGPVAVAPPAAPVLGGRLSYEGHGDGTASIRVQARLPLSQAKPLFRLLMDSGIDLDGVVET